jgi:dihydrolipoamide dehydrogenase
VVGAGPGGYPAAFHAADLGMEVVLIDREENPGGVCLYRGCIPSKAILHAAGAIESARESEALGIKFAPPEIDLDKLRAWKRGVVDKLTGGLGALTRQRNIRYLRGTARFTSPGTLEVAAADGATVEVAFQNAIIATGSVPVRPGFIPESPLIMDSTNALDLECIPGRLLVMGGGYIGLELGQAYATLGSAVSVVEMKASLLPGMEARLVKPLADRIGREFESVMLETRVTAMKEEKGAITVTFENAGAEQLSETYDRVLVAVGRRPVTEALGLDSAGVQTDGHGFIKVDERRVTTAPAIMAVGDIAGHPMLAHKATHEGRAAVEALQSARRIYDPRAIPAVVYTDPEIAWCGLTGSEASRQGMNVKVGAFPWAASGRAATLNRGDGLTTVVADAESGRILGMGIVGVNAGEMIAEGVLAIEMGAVAEDIALTIHAHPSLSETVMEAAESIMGGSTHFFKRNH